MFYKLLLKKCIIIAGKRRMAQYTKTELSNGIKTVTMCDAKTRNSLSIGMMGNLIENITDANNTDLRLIIIAAEGSVFSAGHNLKEIAHDPVKQRTCFNLASELMFSIIDSPVPVIAKVDGIAAAAGCQLVAQCDIAVCTSRSKFSTPGANFGIFCSTPGIALARCVNKMAALHMLLTGLPISAEEAKNIGLVTQVYQPESLDENLQIICNSITSKSRDVIELGKKFFYKQIQCDIRKAYELGADKMVDNLQISDCQEGIQSFIEKRKPHWSKK